VPEFPRPYDQRSAFVDRKRNGDWRRGFQGTGRQYIGKNRGNAVFVVQLDYNLGSEDREAPYELLLESSVVVASQRLQLDRSKLLEVLNQTESGTMITDEGQRRGEWRGGCRERGRNRPPRWGDERTEKTV